MLNSNNKLLFEEESYILNGIAFNVQNQISRFGREKQYCDAYEKALISKNIVYKRELLVGDTGNKLDFLVFDKIVLEMKAKPFILKQDYYQTQTYLQALNLELGIIYNFRDRYIKPHRVLRETRK